ncbi:TIGR03915 family putative DNA repair protein [uncultured Bacteroides sp.]|uniref:TIGR03915 family putative DNA repair protein n=1 Tax=uncultured Bacteroides sp. TaxID=162156 RepID=UPI002602873C|nr:TIGR03915 family putative DNA repair protein [uncultured Bacteroides sp.]
MIVFVFDNTFEGVLTCVFEAYSRRSFPDVILPEGEPLPLFHDEVFTVITEEEKAGRVWRGLQKKLSHGALSCLAQCWLAEEAETPMLIFRYIRKTIDAARSIETNFADADVLAMSRMWKRVDWERIRLMQFIRFQKSADGTFFAAVEPEKNALPLVVDHFKDRFAGQPWLVYDIRRAYGFYYDLKEVRPVTFEEGSREGHLVTGMLDESLMDKDEKLFQQLWKTYFKSICIKERLNPRKHRQDMPVRYWKHLTEKQ